MSPMSINTKSSPSTDRLEMHTDLFINISGPKIFGNSVSPTDSANSTISVEWKESNLSLSDNFETDEYQSFRQTVPICNFLTTSKIISITRRSFDLFFIYVNEHQFITQSPPGILHSESWQEDYHKSYYSISGSSIGAVSHLTISTKCTKPKDGD